MRSNVKRKTKFVSLHHVEGRTKEWITFNGTEDELLKQVYDMIEEERPWLGSLNRDV